MDGPSDRCREHFIGAAVRSNTQSDQTDVDGIALKRRIDLDLEYQFLTLTDRWCERIDTLLSEFSSSSVDDELQTPCNGYFLNSNSITVVIKSDVVDAHVEVANLVVIDVMRQVFIVQVWTVGCEDLLLLLHILKHVDLRRAELVDFLDIDGERNEAHLGAAVNASCCIGVGFDNDLVVVRKRTQVFWRLHCEQWSCCRPSSTQHVTTWVVPIRIGPSRWKRLLKFHLNS